MSNFVNLSKAAAALAGRMWTPGRSRARIEQAERRAEAAESRLQAVVDALPEGIVLLDAEGRYVLWNKRYSDIYHKSADLFERGRRLIETLRIGVMRGDYPAALGREEEWLAEREAALRNPGERHEQQISDGSWMLIEERRTPDGGTVGLRIDITQMKQQAQEMERAAARREEVMTALAFGLSRLAVGDLSCSLETAFPLEYEAVRSDFNNAVAGLSGALAGISQLTEALGRGASEISGAADDLSRRTEHQAASLEETAAALDDITARVRQSAEGAERARNAAGEARVVSTQCGEVVEQAQHAMAEIQTSSQQIERITGVIEEIAFQTSLLAFNASVEAARAGEAGRGFAVIAQEVRGLADKSAIAAKEIKVLISSSTTRVEQGAALVERTGEGLQTIIRKVAEINALVIEMAASTREQSVGLQQVNGAVIQMDQITQKNAAMVQETTASTHELAEEATHLRGQVARFQFKASAEVSAKGLRRVA